MDGPDSPLLRAGLYRAQRLAADDQGDRPTVYVMWQIDDRDCYAVLERALRDMAARVDVTDRLLGELVDRHPSLYDEIAAVKAALWTSARGHGVPRPETHQHRPGPGGRPGSSGRRE